MTAIHRAELGPEAGRLQDDNAKPLSFEALPDLSA